MRPRIRRRDSGKLSEASSGEDSGQPRPRSATRRFDAASRNKGGPASAGNSRVALRHERSGRPPSSWKDYPIRLPLAPQHQRIDREPASNSGWATAVEEMSRSELSEASEAYARDLGMDREGELATSGGSMGSSQRSARRRVELRTPAEEEAVRQVSFEVPCRERLWEAWSLDPRCAHEANGMAVSSEEM